MVRSVVAVFAASGVATDGYVPTVPAILTPFLTFPAERLVRSADL